VRGIEERCKQSFGGGDLREKDQLDYLSVDGRMILIWMQTLLILFMSVH
jgi:hypothetical protein